MTHRHRQVRTYDGPRSEPGPDVDRPGAAGCRAAPRPGRRTSSICPARDARRPPDLLTAPRGWRVWCTRQGIAARAAPATRDIGRVLAKLHSFRATSSGCRFLTPSGKLAPTWVNGHVASTRGGGKPAQDLLPSPGAVLAPRLLPVAARMLELQAVPRRRSAR